jgi:beta-glucosidase
MMGNKKNVLRSILIFFSLISSIFVMRIRATEIKGDKFPYMDATLSVEQRVDDLLKRMTLEEKVYQMCAVRLGEGDEIFKTSGKYDPSFIKEQMGQHGIGHISCPTTELDGIKSLETINEIQKISVEETRLGIPVIVNDEALHGIKGRGTTCFPQAIALSCMWDTDLMERIGEVIGYESYGRGIRQVLSPVLDLARDPRHGRMEETYGEDPYIAGLYGSAFIKGVQSMGVICTPKHFVANFIGEGGRDSKNISLSERELREIHLKPFEMAVKEGKPKSLMAAYNAIDGIPCHANNWLLGEVLRKEWGFNGYTVSDWSGINHIFNFHHVVNSLEDAAVVASRAGLDVDLPRVKSFKTLMESVKLGKISEKDIDENVKRILRVKFELGLFENPYISKKYIPTYQSETNNRALALEAARKSIVLLKNNHGILPLNNKKKIAVIGPNADRLLLGGYSAIDVKGPTPYSGLKSIMGDMTFSYSKGCSLTGNDESGMEDAVHIARDADACILVMGGQYGLTGGETSDRTDLRLMGMQEKLIDKIAATGKPVVVVLIDGRPVEMAEWKDKVDGIVMMFYAGEEGSTALAEILSGKVNPSGKLTMTYPLHTGQLPMPLLDRPYGREGSFADIKTDRKQNFMHTNRYYPLFPFGFGLSYSTFNYSNLTFSHRNLSKDDVEKVSVDVTNNGAMDGDEIVQVYFSDLCCRISPYPRVLKAFKRVSIHAGETKNVSFEFPYKDFSFLNENFNLEADKGDYDIFVGKNCLDGISGRISLLDDAMIK